MFIKTHLVKYITFGFASGITLFPFVLIRKETKLSKSLVQHEKIHLQQQRELLVIPFYLLYFLEYLVKFLKYWNHLSAYKNISFEKEAFSHQNTPGYLAKRKKWSSFDYF